MFAILLAAQLTIGLLPGESLHATCAGQWLAVQTIPDLSGECHELPLPPPTSITVDHTSVALFDMIPTTYLTAARNMRLLMRTASVGQNISIGLDCLVSNAANGCRTGFGVPSSVIPVVLKPEYACTQWLFEMRNNPGWYGKVTDFLAQRSRAGSFEVLSYKQSYADDSTIYKFWDRASTMPNIGNVESMETTGKVVVYWTAAMAKAPIAYIDSWNEQMRAYTATRVIPFFDLADIETHGPDGTECLTDGVPTVCSEYAVETLGGHLSNGMAQQRVAKAWWVLMAQVAGWRP